MLEVFGGASSCSIFCMLHHSWLLYAPFIILVIFVHSAGSRLQTVCRKLQTLQHALACLWAAHQVGGKVRVLELWDGRGVQLYAVGDLFTVCCCSIIQHELHSTACAISW